MTRKRLLPIVALLAFGCTTAEDKPNPGAAGTTGSHAGSGGSSPSDGAAGSTTFDAAPATDQAGVGGTGAAGTTGAAGAPVDASADLPPSPTDAATDRDAPASETTSPTCTTAGTELCDGFESGAIDPKLWGKHTTTGTALTVDNEHVHGGAFALHVKMPPGGQGTAQITDAVTFPAKDNTFYTRAWFYFSPDLPADNNGGFHMAFLLATGNNDLGFVEAGLGSAGDKQYLGYSEYYGAGPNVHQHGPTFTEFGPRSSIHVATKTWVCLELMQGGDATTTHRRVWVDGKELPEQVNDYKDRKPPKFDLMSIGILQYHPTPLLSDVWIDDIRVSSTRIGCAP